MLLRSSSTPVLGSLLSSFSDSPNNNNHYHDSTPKHHIIRQQSLNKLPYYQSGCLNLTTVTCSSSPISEHSYKGMRRAQSEGNLEGLAYASCSSNEHYNPILPKKISGRPKSLMLETIPSFSFYNLKHQYEEEEEEEEEGEEGIFLEEEEDIEQVEENMVTKGNHVALSNKMGDMVLNEEYKVMDRNWNVGFEESRGLICEEMCLAKGLGIGGGGINIGNGNGNNGGGGNGGGSCNPDGGDFGDLHSTEEYYKKMVQENTGNPLFLRNYAQFLYQTKKDLWGAEEYYSRAILADPKDGEILSQYAKLVWELHHDQDRALSYFERAVQASPQDSHVHAAYASFLWEVEEDEDERVAPQDYGHVPPNFHEGAMASAAT